MKKTTKLRHLLKGKELIIPPGIYDCITARLAEKVGFPMVKLLGNVTGASLLGLPDLGFLTLVEMAHHAKNVAASITIPLMADADTGYASGPLGIIRTVREFEQAGLAGISFEDQVTPKRCALIEGGTPVVPLKEQLKKLEAALEARQDEDFVIGARTDAESVYGLDEAIRRAKAYEDAGAGLVSIALTWVRKEGNRERTLSAFKKIRDTVKGPINMMFMDEAIKAGNITLNEVKKLGITMGSGNAVRYTVVKAVTDMLITLKNEGSTKSFADRMASLKEYEALLDLPEYLSLEKRFAAE
ncbi:MAG: oxaloacetate decarboxylase [Candidatus Binatia bacterium]